jgi:quinol-cytochrome oxidoreductase complex cytochrome b subunit
VTNFFHIVGPFVAAFAAGFFADALWTSYVQHIAAKRAWRAAVVSAAIAALGVGAVLIIVHNPLTAIADIVGGFCGTFLMVRRTE